jgi:hypothetical protein
VLIHEVIIGSITPAPKVTDTEPDAVAFWFRTAALPVCEMMIAPVGIFVASVTGSPTSADVKVPVMFALPDVAVTVVVRTPTTLPLMST